MLKTQDELLRHFAAAMDALGVEYAVVGSVASSAYGEARLTHDIDIVVALPPEETPRLARYFPEEEFYFDADALRSAARRGGMFNIIHSASGLKIDLIFKRTDFVKSQLRRRKKLALFPEQAVYVASPEDVVVAKMDFYRKGQSEKHLRDIAGILKVQGASLDHAYIEEWAGRMGLTEIWEAILARLAQKNAEEE